MRIATTVVSMLGVRARRVWVTVVHFKGTLVYHKHTSTAFSLCLGWSYGKMRSVSTVETYK